MSAAKTTIAFEPYCERITWRPGGKSSERNWVCSEEEGKCQGCRDEEWHRYNQEIIDNHHFLIEREARNQRPYRTLWKADDPVAKFVAECGSAPQAVNVIVGGQYEDLYFWLPQLLAWDLPDIEVSRRWYELLARARALVAVRGEP
jgi:hypothetical protein